MRTQLRKSTLALGLALALGLLAGCGSTGGSPAPSTTSTAPTAAPSDFALRNTGALPPGGTTDPGSRYADGADPFGAIAVESDPLADPGALVPVESGWTAAPASTSVDLGPPPANTRAGSRREYRAPPAPPPPAPGGPNRWTTPSGGGS